MKVTIYQIKNIEDCSYAFRDYIAEKFSMKDYECVKCFDLPDAEDKKSILENIFTTLNLTSHSTFRSLSVSDIVELNDTKYYCQGIGWKELEA